MYLPSTPPFILIFQLKIRALQDAVKRNDLSFIAKNSGEVRLLQGEPIDSHKVAICRLPGYPLIGLAFSSVQGTSLQVSLHTSYDPTILQG